MSEMTLQEKAGQVIVGTWDGADAASVDAQIAQIEDLHLGGVIIMGANVPTAEDRAPLRRPVPAAAPRTWMSRPCARRTTGSVRL